MRAEKRKTRSKRTGWLVKLWIVSARTSPRSISDNPFVGSRRRPRDAGFSEIAPAQILPDGGPPYFRPGPRTHVMIVARGRKAALDVSGEQDLHLAKALVFRQHFGPALLQLAGDLGRIAFD